MRHRNFSKGIVLLFSYMMVFMLAAAAQADTASYTYDATGQLVTMTNGTFAVK